MEEVISRFYNLGEEIFDSLDEKTLKNCKKVGKTWKNFIENPNCKLLWIQIIKDNEKKVEIEEFASCPRKWSKLRIQDLREFARKLNLQKNNKWKREELFLEKYVDLKIELNNNDEEENVIDWAFNHEQSKKRT